MKKTTLRQAAMKLALLACVLLAPTVSWGQTTLFSENFEGGSMPTGWTTEGSGSWSVTTAVNSSHPSSAGEGTYCAQIKHGTTGDATKLITPEIDLSGVASAELSFMQAHQSWSGDIDVLNVYYRTSSTGTWVLLESYPEAYASWTTTDGITLPNLSSTYQIAFEFVDNWGYGLGIDYVQIVPGATCPKPSGLAATLTPGNGTIATLNWTAGGSETNWVVEYSTASDFSGATTVTTGFTTSGNSVSVNLTGLTAETPYYARVKADCDGGDYSDWSSESISFTPTNAYSITVNDGTSTNGYIPVYGYYVDASIVSQFIIPANALADMVDGTINKLTFYAAADKDWGAAQFEVYMTEVDYTTFSSTTLVDWTTMDKVMNAASLGISGNQMVVNLDAPYQYTDGNLLIGIKQTVSGDYSSCSWYGVTATGASLGGNNTGSQQNFLPKTTFEYEPAGAFPKPRNLQVSNVTGHEATLTWETPNNATPTGYFYRYKRTTDANFNLPIDNGTSLSVTLNSLDPETEYQFGVYANYADGESDYKEISFTTDIACPAPTVLVVTDITDDGATLGWTSTASNFNVRYRTAADPNALFFDDFENGLSQWTIIRNGEGTENTDWRQFDGNFDNNPRTPHSGTYMAMSRSWSSSAYDVDNWLITPQVPLTGTLKFWVRTNAGWPDSYEVLLSTASNAEVDFTEELQAMAVAPNNGEWNEVVIDLSSYSGNGYIAIHHVDYDKDYLLIDDFGIYGDPTPAGAWTTTTASTNSLPVTGLDEQTTYDFEVQADCGGGEVSNWSEGVSFTTDIACPAPTALTNGTPSPSQVELTWVKNGEETEWQICINNNEENLVDVAEADVNVNSETSVVTYTLTNLTPSTSYEIKVRANCGDVDGPSAWTSPVSFTTQAACPTPILSADGITNITAHTADVEWSNYTENTNYEVSYRTADYFNGVTEEFGTTPTGWAQYTGLLNENGTATLTSANAWFFDSNNGVFDNHARVNIYSNYQRWLVTPALTVPENGALTFDMALTAFSGNLAAPGTSGTDDKFVVLITTDEMATWTVLRQWDNAGSEYVYNNIPCTATGENVMINLGEYVGQTVQVAFYGESTVSNADNNLHIDNVGVGAAVPAGEWQTQNVTENSLQLTNLVAETPYDVKVAGYCDATVGGESATQTFTTTIACPAPTTLVVAANATDATTMVDLIWTMNGAETAWQICINGDEENLVYVNESAVSINNNTVSYTRTGLIPGTDYTFKVRANCEASVTGDGTSDWSNTESIQTEATCTEPTAFNHGTPDVHSVDLTWTESGTATQWQLCVNNDMDNLILLSANDDDVNVDGQNVSYTLSGLTGTTNYSVKVRAYCAAGDGNQSPWVGPTEFRTACEAITTFPWSENFESYAAGNFSDPCWVNEHIIGSDTYIFNIYTSGTGGNSTHLLQLPDMQIGNRTKLVLPKMTLNGNYQFVLDVYRNNSNPNYQEGIRVYASANGEIDDDAEEIAFISRSYATSDDNLIPAESASGWYTYELPIPITSGTCYIILRGESRYGSSTYMDNFVVEVAPTCRKPINLAATATTAHTATLGWTNGEEVQDAWQIAYSTNTTDFAPDNDFTPDGTTTWLVDATTNPFTINGLNANTPYRAYVRANCGTENGVSNWSVLPANFTTLAGDNAPTGLAVSGITSSTATASWTGNTANDLHQLYELYFSTDATAPTDDTDPTHTSNEASYTFTGLTPETQYFVWVRDNCGDDGYSTWVGSASFTTLELCPTPTDLVANNITNNAATVSWNDVNDSYNVRYRVAAGLMSIFSEDFSNGIGDWTMQNCEARTGVSNGTFRFYYRAYPPQYLISPEITGINSDAIVEFTYWNHSTSYPETFQVGLSSTTNDVDAFSWSETITAADQIHYTYHATVPAGTKYIAIKLLSDDQFYLYIDDIVIGESVNAGEWVEINNITENSVDLVGLTAETKYEAQVQGVCSSLSMNTEWTDALSFTTKSLFEKVIEANKWYAIASPMHNDGNNETLAGVNNLTSGTYDLYGYNEGDGTWEKPTTSLNRGKGYIYRRSEGTTLQFVGDANTGSVSVSLTSSCSDNDLKGFNLIGNPYPHAVAINQPHYTLNPNGTWTAHTSNNTIGEAEAFLVYSPYNNNTYYFSDVTPSTPGNSNTASASLAFTVSNGEYSDVAYARLEEGDGLRKIGHLNSEAPMLSIPVEGRRYAIANLGSDCQSFDMVFRGTGTYTLSFNGNTGYCHLIDRVAGKDIDMLRQNYTFSSNGFDADRFMVKLSPDAQENANGNFAYWNGNSWMVEGNGTLQVFDALGRQLFSQEISNSNFEIQNSLFPAAGVYVLRMGEKTQKIVVR